MTILCKHVHRVELQMFLIFVPRIYQLGKIPDFLFRTTMSRIRNIGISSLA